MSKEFFKFSFMSNTTLSNKTKRYSDRSHNFSIFRSRLTQNRENFNNAVLAVLSGASAVKIIDWKKDVGRGNVYWAYYVTAEGKRRATFISPKEFTRYKWFDDFSTVVNLENGTVYEVTENYCSCPSWKYEVKTGKKQQCKHQVMRSEHIGVNLSDSLPVPQQQKATLPFTPQPVKNSYLLNPDILRGDGLSLERSDDFTCREYYLKAWSLPNAKSIPVQKRIGRIIETDDGFMVAGMRGMARSLYKLQRDAINWILNYNGISLELVKAAYIESQRPIEPKCDQCGNELKYVGWITEPDLYSVCGWVEKKLTEGEKRRLKREDSAAIPNVFEAFGGFF